MKNDLKDENLVDEDSGEESDQWLDEEELAERDFLKHIAQDNNEYNIENIGNGDDGVGEDVFMEDALVLPDWFSALNGDKGNQGKRDTRTISAKRLNKKSKEFDADEYDSFYDPKFDKLRPRHRGDCSQEDRPCPWVGCRYHLYLDVSEKTGSIKLNFPDIAPEDMQVSCALDVADLGGVTLETVSALMNLTRERVRQIEDAASVLVKYSDMGDEYYRVCIKGEKNIVPEEILSESAEEDESCGVSNSDVLDSGVSNNEASNDDDLDFSLE